MDNFDLKKYLAEGKLNENKEQNTTAVEWLVKEANLLENNGWILPLIKQAKEMEKQKMIEFAKECATESVPDAYFEETYNDMFK